MPAVRQVVGDRIRVHRQQRGLTQRQLCVGAEIPRSTLQEIERGENDARLSWLAHIAHALDLTLAQLLDVEAPARADRSGRGGLGPCRRQWRGFADPTAARAVRGLEDPA
ncbi:helix-turn-helix domain-containing protein [Streptomyces sp. NPDC021224]